MEKRTYSSNIKNAIERFLHAEGNWNYVFDANKGIFKISFGLRGPLSHIDILIIIYDDEFTVSAISPIAAQSRKKEVAEFVCRVNFELPINGSFLFDLHDGQIIYKTHIPCYNSPPSIKIIKQSIYIPIAIFSKYSPGIIAILFTDINPEIAANICKSIDNYKEKTDESGNDSNEQRIRTEAIDDMLTRIIGNNNGVDNKDVNE